MDLKFLRSKILAAPIILGSGEKCGIVACGMLVAGHKKGLVAGLWQALWRVCGKALPHPMDFLEEHMASHRIFFVYI
jgi:hypothetical protein